MTCTRDVLDDGLLPCPLSLFCKKKTRTRLRDVGVHIGVLADDHRRLALVGVRKVGHDDFDVGEASGHRVEVARQGAVDGRLGDEGGASV